MTDTNTTGRSAADLRDRATQKVEGARSTAAEAIATNPLAVLAGGLAVGVVAGALIPRGERERAALDPIGRRLSEGAAAALAATKETGKERLTASLFSKDVAQESAQKIFQSAVTAAKEAGSTPEIGSANAPQAPTIA